jgi:hypothetical protein
MKIKEIILNFLLFKEVKEKKEIIDKKLYKSFIVQKTIFAISWVVTFSLPFTLFLLDYNFLPTLSLVLALNMSSGFLLSKFYKNHNEKNIKLITKNKILKYLSIKNLVYFTPKLRDIVQSVINDNLTKKEENIYLKLSFIKKNMLKRHEEDFEEVKGERREQELTRLKEYRKNFTFSMKNILIHIIKTTDKKDVLLNNKELIEVIKNNFNDENSLELITFIKKNVSKKEDFGMEIKRNINEINNIYETKNGVIKNTRIKNI